MNLRHLTTLSLALTAGMCTLFMIFSYENKTKGGYSPKTISTYEEIGTKYFEDIFFRPVLEVFKLKSNQKNLKKHFRSGSKPLFLLDASITGDDEFWKEQLKQLTLNYCPLPCAYTTNISEVANVDAILFFLREINGRKMMDEHFRKRDPLQPWIMISFEAPLRANSIYATNYNEFNGVFNRTMTYRADADIIANHGFIISKTDVQFLPKEWRIPPPAYNFSTLENRSTAVAFISNCADDSGRLDYINQMKAYIDVDVYGKCGTFECGSSMYVQHAYKPHTNECFRKVGFRYMFFLAFENSICKDYATEKLYNLLYYPMVPIVLGGADYDKLLPPNSYINAANFSPKELASYLHLLRKDKKLYEKYFQWRDYFIPSTLGGERVMCDLCSKLYDSSFYKTNVISNFSKWFNEDSNCNIKWTINGNKLQ